MKQLVVAPSFPFSTHTFVTREIASTADAGHSVTVLAPTYGDAEGQVLADKLRINLGEVISTSTPCAVRPGCPA